jgi:hypothetical protein
MILVVKKGREYILVNCQYIQLTILHQTNLNFFKNRLQDFKNEQSNKRCESPHDNYTSMHTSRC